MYTILQDTSNKIQLPFKGNYDYILIVFTNRNKIVTAVFENLAGLGCDYDISIVEVGSAGTVDLRNGRIKLSPRATWKAVIYGQDNNNNLSKDNAVELYSYNFQIKGDSCKVYPIVQSGCPDSNVIINGQGGQIADQTISSGGSFTICIVNSLGVGVGLVESVVSVPSDLEANLEIQL